MDTVILGIMGAVVLISYVVFWKNYQYIVGIIILLVGLMLTTQATPQNTMNITIYDNDSSTVLQDLNFTTEDTMSNENMQAINLASTALVMMGLGIVFIDGLRRATTIYD